MDSTLLPFALLCFTSFFTLTNPLGTMPVFLTMTHGMTDKERQSIVRRATIVSFITIMVFVFAGQFLFKFFGISTNGFRIAGGVIIFKIGFDMLQARYTPMKLKDEEIKTYADDISITPLGIPMLCGPGAIANAIVLMQDAHIIQARNWLRNGSTNWRKPVFGASLPDITAVTFVLSATLPKQKRYWRRNDRNTSPPIGNGKPNRQ